MCNFSSLNLAHNAEILMRAALAANEPKAADPAVAWLKSNNYEDPEMVSLAAQLATAGAKK